MAARSGSLGWVILAGAVSFGIAGAMWGILDSTFVDTLISTASWSAPDGSVVQMGREYVITTWNWLLLIVVLRIGLELIVSSRLVGASSMLPFATFGLVAVHLMVVLWALVFPEIAGEMYTQAQNTAAVQQAGYMEAVDLAFEWGIGILPSVLLLVSDGWYLSAPIRNDMLAR